LKAKLSSNGQCLGKDVARTISLSSAVLGAILATMGAGMILIQQAGIFASNVFPMPFLVLLDWAVLGVAGAVYVSLATLRPDARQLQGAWAVLGAYVPLIVIGAFSIGPVALLCALLLLAPTLFLTIRHQVNFGRLLGILAIGILANLTLVLALVMIGRLAR
jgi:hypothetical protein